MCRLPFCFFCGKAKDGPRGSDSPDCNENPFCGEAQRSRKKIAVKSGK